jgi:hypothetical protein
MRPSSRRVALARKALKRFVMTNWDQYFAPRLDRIVPGTAHQAMYVVGAVRIVAGLVVLFAPRFGGYLVALWLLGISPACFRRRAGAAGCWRGTVR